MCYQIFKVPEKSHISFVDLYFQEVCSLYVKEPVQKNFIKCWDTFWLSIC